MATKLTPKKSRGKEPAAKTAAANGPAAAAGAKPETAAKKRLPAARIGAKKELDAGDLNRCADADEMFQKLGHERGDMVSPLSPSKTSPAIWGRIVKPDQATLTPDLARTILKLDFEAEDHRRIEELSTKAQEGALTPEERAELEEYIRVGYELAILRSKARLSLKRANPSP